MSNWGRINRALRAAAMAWKAPTVMRSAEPRVAPPAAFRTVLPRKAAVQAFDATRYNVYAVLDDNQDPHNPHQALIRRGSPYLRDLSWAAAYYTVPIHADLHWKSVALSNPGMRFIDKQKRNFPITKNDFIYEVIWLDKEPVLSTWQAGTTYHSDVLHQLFVPYTLVTRVNLPQPAFKLQHTFYVQPEITSVPGNKEAGK